MLSLGYLRQAVIDEKEIYGFSNWCSDTTYEDITCIKLSYGGGIGGANRKLYATKLTDIPTNQIIEITNVYGKKEWINTMFIVYANNNYQIITREYEGLDYQQNPYTSRIHAIISKGETVRFLKKDR